MKREFFNKEAERTSDEDLVAYIVAVKAGDDSEIKRIKRKRPDLHRRFATVNATLSELIDTYTREIQILRLEVNGWRNVAEGDTAGKCRGKKALAKAEEARISQPELEIPTKLL